MIFQIDKFFIFFFMLIPVFLITGPAIPDIVITLCSLYFLISFLLIKKDFNFLKNKFFLISILFWLSIIFISLFSYNKITSFQDSLIFLRFLLIPTMAYFLLLNNEKRIKITITIIFCSVCFVSIDTFFQFLNYETENGFGGDLFGFKSDWYGRLTGPFGDELVPGAYISKFGLLGYIYLLYFKKNKINNFFEILYLSFLGLVCFSSGERMALATYFLALIFLFLFLANKRLIFLVSIVISLFLIFISTKIHPFYNDYKIINSTHYHQGLTVEKYFDCKENNQIKCKKIINLQPGFFEILKNFSSSAYGEIYTVGINMFKDNILTGVGVSNYQTVCQNSKKYRDIMVNYSCASHPHNTYIHMLSEGGVIVFVSFITFIGAIIYNILNGNNIKTIKLITLASIIILFWPFMSTGSLIKNWNGVFTFYIIGLCISLNRFKIKLK